MSRARQIENAAARLMLFLRENVHEVPEEGLVTLTSDESVSGVLAARLTALENELRRPCAKCQTLAGVTLTSAPPDGEGVPVWLCTACAGRPKAKAKVRARKAPPCQTP